MQKIIFYMTTTILAITVAVVMFGSLITSMILGLLGWIASLAIAATLGLTAFTMAALLYPVHLYRVKNKKQLTNQPVKPLTSSQSDDPWPRKGNIADVPSKSVQSVSGAASGVGTESANDHRNLVHAEALPPHPSSDCAYLESFYDIPVLDIDISDFSKALKQAGYTEAQVTHELDILRAQKNYQLAKDKFDKENSTKH